MDYQTYLRSAQWQRLRAQALARDGYRCRTCNAEDTLEVHHRTYTYLGQESDDALQDLTTLCHACHEVITSALRQRRYAARPVVPPNTIRVLPGAPRQGKEEPLDVHHLLRHGDFCTTPR